MTDEHDETKAVTWIKRLWQLQGQGYSFDQAITIANSEFPYESK